MASFVPTPTSTRVFAQEIVEVAGDPIILPIRPENFTILDTSPDDFVFFSPDGLSLTSYITSNHHRSGGKLYIGTYVDAEIDYQSFSNNALFEHVIRSDGFHMVDPDIKHEYFPNIYKRFDRYYNQAINDHRSEIPHGIILYPVRDDNTVWKVNINSYFKFDVPTSGAINTEVSATINFADATSLVDTGSELTVVLPDYQIHGSGYFQPDLVLKLAPNTEDTTFSKCAVRDLGDRTEITFAYTAPLPISVPDTLVNFKALGNQSLYLDN